MSVRPVPDWFSVKQLCQKFALSRTTIIKAINEGAFFSPGIDSARCVIRIGADIRVSDIGVNYFIDSHVFKAESAIAARTRGELMRKAKAQRHQEVLERSA